jgi:hypothetical protein
MNKKLTLFVFVFFGALILSSTYSCEKVIEELTPNFSCDIDGVNWTTHSVIGSASDSGIMYMAMEDSTMVTLTVKNLTEGDFVIDNTNNFATYTKDNSENIYLGTSGSIHINKVTESNVDLSFHFKGFNIIGDSVEITNGVGENLLYITQ